MAGGDKPRRNDRATGRARFEELYETHFDALLAYALRRSDTDSAYDVVSETFLACWRRLDDVPEDALPWLYGVARRMLANQRRSARRRQSLFSRLARDRAESSSPEPRSCSPALGAALARLSRREREALELSAWEGLDGNRAAVALGISPVAFRVRLHRAKRRLAEELEREESAEHVLSSTAEESP
jgi:RNA polymerase sigma factor (sigma-70 family)